MLISGFDFFSFAMQKRCAGAEDETCGTYRPSIARWFSQSRLLSVADFVIGNICHVGLLHSVFSFGLSGF